MIIIMTNEVVQQSQMVKCKQIHMKLIILEENFKKEEFIIRKRIDNVNKWIDTRSN